MESAERSAFEPAESPVGARTPPRDPRAGGPRAADRAAGRRARGRGVPEEANDERSPTTSHLSRWREECATHPSRARI